MPENILLEAGHHTRLEQPQNLKLLDEERVCQYQPWFLLRGRFSSSTLTTAFIRSRNWGALAPCSAANCIIVCIWYASTFIQVTLFPVNICKYAKSERYYSSYSSWGSEIEISDTGLDRLIHKKWNRVQVCLFWIVTKTNQSVMTDTLVTPPSFKHSASTR